MTRPVGERVLQTAKESDKRRFKRHSRRFPLTIRIVGGRMRKDDADRPAEACNASRGGLLVVTNFLILPETLVELHLPDRALGSAKVLNGRIRWYRKRAESGEHEAGLAFVRITPPEPLPPASTTDPEWPEPAEHPSGGRDSAVNLTPAERRRSPRKAKKMLVRVTFIPEERFRQEPERSALLLDLSAEGAELSLSREYAPGSMLLIRFPDRSPFPRGSKHAQVVWTRPGDMLGKSLIGVSFVPDA